MSYKAVLRVVPLKLSEIKPSAKHQERSVDEALPNYDKNKSSLNRTLLGSGDIEKDVLDIVKRYKHHPKASVCAEMILTASEEYFNTISPEWRKGIFTPEMDKWIKAQEDFLHEKYGEGVASMVLHLDEKTPHIHAMVIPISEYDISFRRGSKTVKKIKYNNVFGDDAKTIKNARITGNSELTKLGKLQSDYSNFLEKNSIDLSRGDYNSPANHKTKKQYDRDIKINNKPYMVEDLIITNTIGPNGIQLDKDIDKKLRRLDILTRKSNTYNQAIKANKELKEQLTKEREINMEKTKKIEELTKEQKDTLRRIPLEKVADILGYQESIQDEKGKYKWRNAIDMTKEITQLSFNDSINLLHKEFGLKEVSNEVVNSLSPSIERLAKPEYKRSLTKDEKEISQLCESQLIALGGNDGTKFRITLMHKDKASFNLGKDKNGGEEKFFDMKEVLEKIPYLNLKNNKDKYNIFITPFSQKYDFYLVDDLDKTTLGLLKSDGYNPNILINSSRESYQGIFLYDVKLDKNFRNKIFGILNDEYGDPNIKAQIHPFRLAGFKNTKPKHEKDGKFPIVSLISQPIRNICQAFKDLVKHVQDSAKQQLLEEQEIIKKERQEAILDAPGDALAAMGADELAIKLYKALQSRYGNDFDASRADWMVIDKLKNKGYQESDIRNVLIQNSPNLHERHKDINRYLDTTFSNIKQRLTGFSVPKI